MSKNDFLNLDTMLSIKPRNLNNDSNFNQQLTHL